MYIIIVINLKNTKLCSQIEDCREYIMKSKVNNNITAF